MDIKDNISELGKTTKQGILSALPIRADELDIRNILKRDHALVAGMIDSLLDLADRDQAQVQDLCESLRAELLTHSQSEERVLYQACRKHGKDIREFAQEGEREHHLIERMLDQMVTERPGKDGEFKATVTVLKELVEHHVREEEGDLFPKLQAQFSNEQLLEMGEMMERSRAQIVIPPVQQTAHTH